MVPVLQFKSIIQIRIHDPYHVVMTCTSSLIHIYIHICNYLTTSGTPHVARSHKTDNEGLVPPAGTSWDVGRIEVRWVVLVQHLALRHLETSVTSATSRATSARPLTRRTFTISSFTFSESDRGDS